MRGRTGITAVVAALTVVLATLAHVLAGGTVPASAWPVVTALGGACFLLGLHSVPRPVLIVALGAVQLGLHLGLGAAPAPVPAAPDPHLHHHGPDPAATTDAAAAHGGHAGLLMPAAHLGVLLVSLVLLRQAHRWWLRLVDVLARVRPDRPRPFAVAAVRPARPASARPRPFAQRWLPADVRRRGPPPAGVVLIPS